MSHSPPPPPQESLLCLWPGLWTCCGPVGATQTLIWPNCCMCLPLKTTAARARPFSFVEHSLSAQVLHGCRVYLANHRDLICSLYSWWKNFRSSSLVTPSLGFSLGFIPTAECGPPTGVWSWGCLGALGPAPVRIGHRGGMPAWITGILVVSNAQGSWRPWAKEIWP